MKKHFLRSMICCLLALALSVPATPVLAFAGDDVGNGEEVLHDEALSAETFEVLPHENKEPVDAPAVLLSGASLQSVTDVVVTTGDATNIKEFTADVPVTAFHSEMLELMKGQSGCLGVEYRADGESRLFRQEAMYGDENANFAWLDQYQTTTVQYTAHLSCLPDTTYHHRAYCRLDTGETFYGEWKSFTTAGFTATPLDPNAFVPVSAGQPVYFTFIPESTGFYTLSTTSETGTGTGTLSVLNAQSNDWDSSLVHYFEAGVVQSIRLSTFEDGQYKAQISPSSFPLLALDAPQSIRHQENSLSYQYFTFTPDTDGYYTISATQQGAESTGFYVNIWDVANKGWNGPALSQTLYMNAGTAQFIRFATYALGEYTLQVSEFTSSVETFSIETGEAKPQENGFWADISVTVAAPISSSFRVGVEYESEKGSGRFSGKQVNNCTSEHQTLTVQLDTLPSTTYSYRAYLEPMTNGAVSGAPVCGEWKEFFTKGNITQLMLNQTVDGSPQKQMAYSFTPEATGYYEVSVTGSNSNLQIWDTAQSRWIGYNSSQPLRIEAGATRYLRLSYYGNPYTITVGRYTSTVNTYTIHTAEVGNTEAFFVNIRVTGSVPLDSSFQAGIEYWTENGNRKTSDRSFSNYSSENFTEGFSLNVFPNTTYQYRAYLRPDGGEIIYGEERSFTSGSGNVGELQLDSPLSVQPGGYEDQYFSFIPTETGRYTVSITGTGNGSWGIWSSEIDNWIGDNLPNNNSATVSMEAGVIQYIRVYVNTGSNCEITVSRFVPTVTSFAVETGDAQNIRGFTADIPLSVSVPLGSNFQAGVEYELSNGGWRRQNGGGSQSSTSEHPPVSVRFYTLPGKTYRYRAYVYESNNYQNPIYVAWKTFTAAREDSDATELALDTAQTVSRDHYSGADTRFFKFTPAETGYYTVSVAGGNGQLHTANAAQADWTEEYFSGSCSATCQMEAGVPQYIGLLMHNFGNYTIKITRFTPSVTTASVKTGDAVINGAQLQIPVTVTAPLGSNFQYGILYCISGADRFNWGPFRPINTSTAEQMSEIFSLPVIPGKTYLYRAYLYNIKTQKYVYDDQRTISIPAAAETPALTLGNEMTSTSSTGAYFTFTPAKTGCYAFSAKGLSGYLTVMKEDGTLMGQQSYHERENAEVVLILQANETVHLVQAALQGSQHTLVVDRKPLSAARMDSSVTVRLEAEQAGQYIIAIYDRWGKLLTHKFYQKQNSGEDVISLSFAADNSAVLVKAFLVDQDGYQPLMPAEDAEIPFGYYS